MMKFISGQFMYPIEPTEESLREHFKKSFGIILYGFSSKDETDSIVKKFPKYTKVKSAICTGNKPFEEFGIHSEKLDGHEVYKAYGIGFYISPTNDVTGEFNETGQKRLNKFIDILKKEGYIS